MKSLLIGLGIFVGVVILLGVMTLGNMSKVKNNCVRYEKQIEARHGNMENIHSNTWKRVAGKANVVGKYSSDLKELVKSYVEGRGGNAKLASSVKEAIPNLSPDLYKDIMVTIEEGNNEFKVSQTEKIELISQYEIYLESGIIRPMVVGMFGYPKIDLKEMKTVISVGESKKVFETKEDVVQKVF